MLFSPRICHDVALLVLHDRHYSEIVVIVVFVGGHQFTCFAFRN